MNQVNQFLQKIQLEKQADLLLKQSYKTNEADIAHLLNNKSNRHATGKLTEYKILLNTCAFKLVVYWRLDKFNREFTVQEKRENKHRRFIPSVDQIGKKRDQEIGLNTLIDYCLQNANRLDAAQIYYNDRINNQELLIFKFNAQNIAASDFREIQFKTNEFGSRYFEKMIDEPIRVDTIKF
jgi:hypothetical protein